MRYFLFDLPLYHVLSPSTPLPSPLWIVCRCVCSLVLILSCVFPVRSAKRDGMGWKTSMLLSLVLLPCHVRWYCCWYCCCCRCRRACSIGVDPDLVGRQHLHHLGCGDGCYDGAYERTPLFLLPLVKSARFEVCVEHGTRTYSRLVHTLDEGGML